jgi:hypothetical protein
MINKDVQWGILVALNTGSLSNCGLLLLVMLGDISVHFHIMSSEELEDKNLYHCTSWVSYPCLFPCESETPQCWTCCRVPAFQACALTVVFSLSKIPLGFAIGDNTYFTLYCPLCECNLCLFCYSFLGRPKL